MKSVQIDVKKLDLFIDGEYVESSNDSTFEVKNPATQEIIAHVSEASEEDVDRAVELQDKHLKKVLGGRCLLQSVARKFVEWLKLFLKEKKKLHELRSYGCRETISMAAGK